jgi:two-component system, LytTR family, sensor kinase
MVAMSNQKTSWRRPTLLFVTWTLIGLVFAAVSYGVALSQNDKRFGITAALKLNLVLFYLWGVFSPLILRFCRRFRVEFRRLSIRNLTVHVPAVVLFAAVHETLLLAILWSITASARGERATLTDYYARHFGYGFYIDLIIASLIVIGAHALLYYDDFRASELQQSSLKTELAQAQLRALKMQVHPHFLFNTLHSISSLVLEDPPKANSMIARLGDFLRLTIENSEQQLVTLKEETEFLRCYLDIEQVRFGDRLTVAFALEPQTLSAQVPHLILQPVVENAIQHAIAPRAARGHINIEAKRLDSLLRVTVSDNGPGIISNAIAPAKKCVGLTNVRTRLQQIYGSDFRFELTNGGNGGLTVVMEIPFQREALPGIQQRST